MFDALETSFKKNGLNTTREGDNITIQGLAKETKKPTPKPKEPAEQTEYTADKNYPVSRADIMLQDHIRGAKGFKGATEGKKAGGAVKMAKGGSVKSSASKRADGIAAKGKTKGRMI